MKFTFRQTTAAAVLVLAAPCLRAEPKPANPADLPKIVVAAPMGVPAGGTVKVVLRGLKLDGATEVRCQAPMGKAKLLGKGSAGGLPRNEDAPRLGNTQAEIEVTLPADYPGATVTVTLVNAAGESNAHRLLVDRGPILAEKEPNNGFQQAQQLDMGQTIAGVIDRGFDVDVFRFDGKAGQIIVAEVTAARYGSALDSFLTLYDAAGQIVAANDDLDASTVDSRLEVALPRDGVYYLGLADANDQGSPAHVYRLSLKRR